MRTEEELTEEIKKDIDEILPFFGYKHLPDFLQEISEPFHNLAHKMSNRLACNKQTYQFLVKLLEAKDCAVRAGL